MSAGRLRVLVLAGADVICIYACWMLALWGYQAAGFGHYKFGLEFYLRLWPIGIGFVVLNALFRLYHGNPFYPATAVPPQEELRRLVGSSFVAHVGLIAVLAFARQTTVGYSRFAIAAAGVLTAFFAQPLRDAVRSVLHRLKICQIPVSVIGVEPERAQAVNRLRLDAYAGLRPVAAGGEKTEILLVASAESAWSRALVEGFERHAHLECLPTNGFGAASFVNQLRLPALRAEKRVLDVLLASLAFVLLSPLMAVVAILVKVTSPGPVFYRQARLGKRGRPLRVWKFRSMYVDADRRLKALLAADPACRAEWERNFKLARDPRVTPLGRLLRKTSIDEIPQLFNVFCGEMALVGPRPIVAEEVPYYGAAYETFSSVRPGVTGLWQVSGRSELGYDQRVALDMYYVRNWSPWLDFWILRKTVGAVFLMRGAC